MIMSSSTTRSSFDEIITLDDYFTIPYNILDDDDERKFLLSSISSNYNDNDNYFCQHHTGEFAGVIFVQCQVEYQKIVYQLLFY